MRHSRTDHSSRYGSCFERSFQKTFSWIRMEFSSHNFLSSPSNTHYHSTFVWILITTIIVTSIQTFARLSFLSMALGFAYYYLSQRWASRVWLPQRPSAMVMAWIMMTRYVMLSSCTRAQSAGASQEFACVLGAWLRPSQLTRSRIIHANSMISTIYVNRIKELISRRNSIQQSDDLPSSPSPSQRGA
jgi:hypothetical protein